MAEAHSIAGRIEAAGADRLTAGLARAFADDADLGTRAAQIGAPGLSRDGLADALRFERIEREAAFAKAGVRSPGYPQTDARLVEVERMTVLARASCGPDTAEAAGAMSGAAH